MGNTKRRIKLKEFIVKENESFRLRVTNRECLAPKGLYNFEFINEQLKDGEITMTSTYNFSLNQSDIDRLIKGLSL